MRLISRRIVAAGLAIGLAACGGPRRMKGNPTIAVVGGSLITQTDVLLAYAHGAKHLIDYETAQGRQQLLHPLLVERALAVTQWRETHANAPMPSHFSLENEKRLVNEYLIHARKGELQVSDGEVAEFFRRNANTVSGRNGLSEKNKQVIRSKIYIAKLDKWFEKQKPRLNIQIYEKALMEVPIPRD